MLNNNTTFPFHPKKLLMAFLDDTINLQNFSGYLGKLKRNDHAVCITV